MKKKILSALVALLLTAGAVMPAVAEGPLPTPDPEAITFAAPVTPAPEARDALPFSSDPAAIERAADSCFLIRVYNDAFEGPIVTAAGFTFLAPDILVTNRHVIENADRVTAESDDGALYEALGVIAADPESDLALIRFDRKIAEPLTPASAMPRRGDPVAVIGSPLGYKNVISFGNIGALAETEARTELIFTAPISAGSSGGALFDMQGNVIGVTAEMHLSEYALDAQNLSVAVDIGEAVLLYSMADPNVIHAFSDLENAVPQPVIVPLETPAPERTPAPAPTARPASMDFKKLRRNWPDVRGWVTIDGTGIDYPIVQAEDNIYYLNHLPNGDDSASGAIFIDCANAPDFTDAATTIHGHHLKSGKMFGSLESYLDEQYYYEHPVVKLMTPAGDYDCAIFAASYVDADTFSYPASFLDAADYDAFIRELKAGTPYETGIEPVYGERLLILSTCAYVTDNARFLIAAVLNPDR